MMQSLGPNCTFSLCFPLLTLSCPNRTSPKPKKKNLLPTDMLGLRHANLYFKSNLREKQRDHPYKSETPCNFLETLGLEKEKP